MNIISKQYMTMTYLFNKDFIYIYIYRSQKIVKIDQTYILLENTKYCYVYIHTEKKLIGH